MSSCKPAARSSGKLFNLSHSFCQIQAIETGGAGIRVDRNTMPSLDSAASIAPDALGEEEKKVVSGGCVGVWAGFGIHIGQLLVLNGATP